MAAKKPNAAKKVLNKSALKRIKGGDMTDVTVNQAKTGQKLADKTDQYLRS